MLPMGYKTVIDFRNVVQNKIYVDKNAVDEPIDDLSAPADVRSAPAPRPPAPSVEATPVSQGVWLLHGTGRRQLHPLRVRRSPHDVRGAVEPGVDQGAHRSRARDGAGQTADRTRRLASPLRSHGRHPPGDGRRADDHRAQGNGRAVPRDRAPQGHDRAGCARRDAEAAEVPGRRRSPAAEGRVDAGRSLSRRLEQPHGGRAVRLRAEGSAGRRGRLLRRRLGAVLVAEHVRGQHRVSAISRSTPTCRCTAGSCR